MVIAPHAKDEILGCGGYLLHNKGRCQILLVVATIGGKDDGECDTRLEEFKAVCTRLGAIGVPLYRGKDAGLENVSAFKLTARLNELIYSFKPTEIFVSVPYSNQDGNKLYNCAMAALPIWGGYHPTKIFMYEYPFTVQVHDRPDCGRVYHDITDVVDDKVKLFNLYGSQVKDAPSPYNERGIKALAAVRGLESGYDFMEMYYLQKAIL